MARSVWLVMSRCKDPAREEEFNHWYETVHLRDVLEYPEFLAAQRWQLVGPPSRGEPTVQYLALYELDSDDPRGVLERVLTMPDEAVRRGITAQLSARHAGRLLKRRRPEPTSMPLLADPRG